MTDSTSGPHGPDLAAFRQLIDESSLGSDGSASLRARTESDVAAAVVWAASARTPPVPRDGSMMGAAAAALGWAGAVIDDVGVLGYRVSAVVEIVTEVHEWRLLNGWPPQPDPAWFRTWFNPGSRDRTPLPAVVLIGILISDSDPERALTACATLISLAPCAVVLDQPQSAGLWPIAELDYYGVGVVAMAPEGDGKVVVSPEDRSKEFGPSLYGRWLQEVLYARIVKMDTPAIRAGRSSYPGNGE